MKRNNADSGTSSIVRNESNRIPVWLGGILIAFVLILISTQGGTFSNPELIRRFAPSPSAATPRPFQPPQIQIPELPPEIQHTLASLRERFLGGQQVPALTPVTRGPRMQVEVKILQRNGDQVHVIGTVANISDVVLTIPAGTFSFRDSAGVSYATQGGSTTLQPGQSTSLDLTVPLPPSRGLTLVATLPPDPPIEQLLVITTTP